MGAGEVVITVETPLQDDVALLVAELDAAISAQAPGTPDDFNFRLTAEDMAGADTTVWVARIDGQAVGCGALRLKSGGDYGEVKRMYVRPAFAGRGIGGRILATIEAAARDAGAGYLMLETDENYGAACRVYRRAGFRPRGAFGEYPDNPYSLFMEKRLEAPQRRSAALA
ncbi:GNAT family N-acetyltransferase [Consotaella aegiceratis]|uniref:GNAT family N-acetyltransferase n=1 Tax=Consotaella aegiceratis TaxID=3097961 RepID=UPI002F3E68B8